MADLTVNKQTVIDTVIKECNADGAYGYIDAKSIIDLLNRLPEAIIRCKDCIHYNAGFECLKEGYGIEHEPEYFCGDAVRDEERRDDG